MTISGARDRITWVWIGIAFISGLMLGLVVVLLWGEKLSFALHAGVSPSDPLTGFTDEERGALFWDLQFTQILLLGAVGVVLAAVGAVLAAAANSDDVVLDRIANLLGVAAAGPGLAAAFAFALPAVADAIQFWGGVILVVAFVVVVAMLALLVFWRARTGAASDG